MAIRDDYNFELLVNDAERFVIDELEKQIPESKMCKCNDCVLDVATLALNKVKPHYHTSLLGEMYAQAIDQTDYLNQVKKAVTDAIKKITNNPSHD